MRFYTILIITVVGLLCINKYYKDIDVKVKKMGVYLVKSFMYLLGLNLQVEKPNSLFHLKDKVIMIANHQNYLDWVFLLEYLINENRHDYTFVFKKEICGLPLIGDLLYEKHIYVERDLQKDIINIKNQVEKLGDKYIIIIFPEGTFSDCSDYRRFSNDYLKLIGKEKMYYCLSPKYNGLKLLMDNIPHDQVIDSTLIFPENYPKNYEENILAISASSLLLDQYPRECILKLKEVNINIDNIKSELIDIFIQKDKEMKKFYKNHSKKYMSPYKILSQNFIILITILIILKNLKYINRFINNINNINELNNINN